jgi:hypothetical protein
MGAGLLAVKSGFILFIKNYQFPIQINTLERERDRRREKAREIYIETNRVEAQGFFENSSFTVYFFFQKQTEIRGI